MKKIVSIALAIVLIASLCLLSVFADGTEVTNLALGRPVDVTIDSGNGNLGSGFWDKDYLTDGQVPVFGGEGDQSRLGWYAQTMVEAIDCKLTIDLGGLCAVSKVVLSPQTFLDGAQFPTDYTIQVSTDGSTWTDVTGETGHTASSTANVVLTFDEVDARYVRMAITKAGVAPGDGTYHTGFAEFEIYGYAKGEIAEPDTEVYTAAGGGIVWDAGVWLANETDVDGHGGRTFGAMVNTSAPILEAGVPNYWASNPNNNAAQARATVHINVYKFDTNYAATKKTAPVASGEVELAGDTGVGEVTEVAGTNCKIVANGSAGAKLVFNTPLEAGQYLIEFSQVTQEAASHYLVLPMTQEAPGSKATYYLNDVLQENLTGRIRLLLKGSGELLDVTADAEASVQLSLDALAINQTTYPVSNDQKGESTITINEGDKLYILGWAAKTGTNLDKVIWQYIEGDHKFNEDGVEIITKDCSDTYRSRTEISPYINVNEAFLTNSGFGLDNSLMELVGVDELAPGTYSLRIRACFEDGSEGAIKKKFVLNVVETPKVKVILGTEETTVKPDAVSQVALSMDEGSMVVATNSDASDPWVSIPLNNIDTSVYTSFTVKYRLVGESSFAANNVYLRDTEVNKGYSGVGGTWHAPEMDGKTERTFVIADDFPTMAGTLLTGVRFVACKPGQTFIIDSITFNKAEEPHTPVTRSFDSATDNQYFDAIFINDEEGPRANGNDAVAALKALIDGSAEEINKIGLYGWFASDSPIEQFGYILDDADPVFDDSFVAPFGSPEEEATITGTRAGGKRYRVNVDVSGLKDGAIHVIKVVAKLENGDIVIFDRPNREAIVNYQAPASAETPFVEYMSRDQVTIDGVDKASFGGNAEVTDIADNLYADLGKQLRFWGWYGNNKSLEKYGVRVDGGEAQYFDRYEAEDIVNHFKANLIKDDDVYASRFEIFVDITEGQHTAEVFAVVNGEEHLIWTINYNCMPEEVPQTTEPGTEPPQTGDALLAMFAVIAVLAMSAAVVFARRKTH